MLARALLLSFLLCLFASAVLPQASFTGTIVGTVTDPAGAVIAGAKVTVTNTATNEVARTAADTAGNYFVPNLRPGTYKVEVEASGLSVSSGTKSRSRSTSGPGSTPAWPLAAPQKRSRSSLRRPHSKPRPALSAR